MPTVKIDSDLVPYWVQYPDTHWDYTVDWTDTMNSVSDSITSAVWSVTTSGLATSSATSSGQKRGIFVSPSAGNVGSDYKLLSKIFTTGGRIQKTPFKIKVRDP